MIGRLAWIVGVAALLVVLWIMPAVFFPHPGVNDSLEFAFLGPLLYVITIIAALLSLVSVGPLGWKAEGPVGLGVFFFGVAAAFVLSIVTFGNFSDDRFAPLFLTPALAVPVGVALMVAALLMRSRPRGRLLIGMARGVVGSDRDALAPGAGSDRLAAGSLWLRCLRAHHGRSCGGIGVGS